MSPQAEVSTERYAAVDLSSGHAPMAMAYSHVCSVCGSSRLARCIYHVAARGRGSCCDDESCHDSHRGCESCPAGIDCARSRDVCGQLHVDCLRPSANCPPP